MTVGAKLDSGSKFCNFQPRYAEWLGLDLNSGIPETIRTATVSFPAYGHEVTLQVGVLQSDGSQRRLEHGPTQRFLSCALASRRLIPKLYAGEQAITREESYRLRASWFTASSALAGGCEALSVNERQHLPGARPVRLILFPELGQ